MFVWVAHTIPDVSHANLSMFEEKHLNLYAVVKIKVMSLLLSVFAGVDVKNENFIVEMIDENTIIP